MNIKGLSENDRRVLAVAQFSADTSIPKLAKESGLREHAVRYSIQSLQERKLISFSPLINLFALGYQAHSLLFSLSTRSTERASAARKFLLRSPITCFVTESGGEFQFGAMIATRSLLEVDTFVEELSSSIGHEIFQKEYASHLVLKDFRADYLYESLKKKAPRTLVSSAKDERVDIDNLDHRILQGITAWDFKNKSVLARSLAMPVATLDSRIARLEEKKVILGYRFLVASHSLGMQRMWAALSVKGVSSSMTERFFEFCEQDPYVRYATRSLGAWDFDIGFDSIDAPNQSLFLQRMYDTFSADIAGVRVIPILKFLKVTQYPFR